MFRSKSFSISLIALASLFIAHFTAPAAHAVTVSASGTNPAICDQQVNNATGVTATRLSGGDCLVKFTSTGITYSWTAPENLYSVTYLIVGGGGSGGTGWDSTGAAGGAGGMVLTGSSPITQLKSYEIQVGAGGAQSLNTRTYNNGNSGSSSKFADTTALGGGFGYTSRAHSGVAQAGGLAQVGSVSAATGGSAGGGGTGGAGGGGAGGAGGAASGSVAGNAGAGISSSITDTAITYGAGGAGGAGGAATATGAAGGANTGKGGGGGVGGNAASASGGTGGSGVVIIRYSTSLPTVNSFALAGNPTIAIFRAATTINIDVNVSSRVTFLVNRKRINDCVSLAATGSSSSYTASCTWKPSTKGAMLLTAQIKPNSPGLASFASDLSISVVARTNRR